MVEDIITQIEGNVKITDIFCCADFSRDGWGKGEGEKVLLHPSLSVNAVRYSGDSVPPYPRLGLCPRPHRLLKKAGENFYTISVETH